MKRSLVDRFDAKWISEPNSGCWLWIGASSPSGYGNFAVGRRQIGAHRFSWDMRRGPIPEGMHVCHKCDVPACVNPDHLFLGTVEDNMNDMKRKGRAAKPRGEASAYAKISEATARSIKYSIGTLVSVAAQYGVSTASVWKIRRGDNWGHV